MTTHVFVVDCGTFKIHLEYLFVGTGAKNFGVDFNNDSSSRLKGGIERLLVSMIADASRIRKGDAIIFYLQQDFDSKIYEGKFYGIFTAAHDWSFLDNNDTRQYLKSDLQKSLTFRALIEPGAVYAEGVSEWEALDEIKQIHAPYQMLWSLIYRKLKGNRGNTMITIYEAERLVQLIRNKNQRKELDCSKNLLSFDAESQSIVVLDKAKNKYVGRREDIEILPRLISKFNSGKAFEPHLQAYILRSLGKMTNKSLDQILLSARVTIEWMGNEVSCGVGMQRIDLLYSMEKGSQRILVPIELKAVEPDVRCVQQILRYIDWLEQYYLSNRQSDILPCIIAQESGRKSGKKFAELVKCLREFNATNSNRCYPIRLIEYVIDGSDLDFKEYKYPSP